MRSCSIKAKTFLEGLSLLLEAEPDLAAMDMTAMHTEPAVDMNDNVVAGRCIIEARGKWMGEDYERVSITITSRTMPRVPATEDLTAAVGPTLGAFGGENADGAVFTWKEETA